MFAEMQVQKIQAGKACRNKGNRCTVQQVREQDAGNRRAGAGSGHNRQAGKACGHTGGDRPTPFFFSIASRAIARIRSVSRTERSSFSQKNETICESELSKKLLITEFIKLRVYASLATSGR